MSRLNGKVVVIGGGSKRDRSRSREEDAGVTPLGRIGRPEEMASAIQFPVSDESGYCVRFNLVADGGINQVLA